MYKIMKKMKFETIIAFCPIDNKEIKLYYNVSKNYFIKRVSNEDIIRYLKGFYTDIKTFKELFVDRFVNIYDNPLMKYTEKTIPIDENGNPKIELIGTNISEDFHCEDIFIGFLSTYENVKPFSYEEAIKIKNKTFKEMVLNSINIQK